MTGMTPPPAGPDFRTWARQLNAFLSRSLSRLQFKTPTASPSESGVLVWDDAQGVPQVSKSGAWYNIAASKSTVYVSGASGLSGTLSSDVIYIIDGEIDMGASSIDVPEGGLYIQGLSFGVSRIISTENSHTLFTYSGAYAGDLFLYGVDIEASGTGSQVFDLDNDENGSAVECVNTNFSNCTSLGELANYRQGLWSNLALLFCVDGLTMSGAWSGGFRATTAVVVGSTFTGTIFKAGTGLTIGGRFITDMNALALQSSGAFCDFAPSNITNNASFLAQGVSVNSAANAFPNMPASSVKARFSKCVGTPNTYVGGQWELTTTAGTSVTAGTPAKLAGTTTYSDMQWFSQTTDNAFVYDGSDTISVMVRVDAAYSAGARHDVITYIRKWDDSASAYVDIAKSGAQSMTTSFRVEAVSIHGVTDMDTNDRIEVWVESDRNGTVTADLGGQVSVSERAS